jgi:hypothetical protein
MDDNAPKENPPAGFNKLDLTQLQGFSFGTQWTQEKSSPSEARDHDDRPRRDNRRDNHGAPGGGAPPRDRRTFRKPVGAPNSTDNTPPVGGGAPERQNYSGDRAPRRDGGAGGEYRGGPRRDSAAGDRGSYHRYNDRTAAPFDRGPYDSPYFAVTFYPEDTSFNTLVQTIRKSCRTIELFEIARTVVAKLDRFIVVLTRKTPAVPAGAEAPAKQPIYLSVPDGLPFETEEAAVSHVLNKHLGLFFDSAEVEIDPPKGNFQVINKCSITGELLGPPNYHRYAQIVQQHHAAKVSRMSLEAYRGRIETIRDPEVVAQWLAKMKKTTRYTWKNPSSTKPAAANPTPAAPAAANPVEATPPAEGAAPVAEVPAVAPAEAAPPAIAFDSFEDARAYLLTQARDKVVRALESVRFHGVTCEQLVPGEIYNAVEGALERQRRFPLDTANALRGRLRREHFTIFKKGSKGVSYVCAVKRKFRVPGQTFADSIGALIGFIESHPMVRASELPTKFLGIKLPAAPAAAGAATSITTPPVETPAVPEPVLTIEERAKIARLQGDLVWLVREGYVTEFIDGRLFAPPPMVEARKKEVEAEEHDPENFPDVPPETRPPIPTSSQETTPPVTVVPVVAPATEPVSEVAATPPAETS